ncbi:MAG: hypothetical protein K2P85_00245 [Flavobacteriaceae bacterium]|nr:hypothetical protein [Flavobacteriaceae bacterium]
MSLTSIILNNIEVRDKLKSEFPRPEFNLVSKIKAVPLSTNYSLVGAAFDYLMRFYLEYHNKDVLIYRSSWVAESARKSLNFKLLKIGNNNIRIGSNRDKIVNAIDLFLIIDDGFIEAENNYKKFILSGKITSKLLISCLFLGKLDSFYRRRVIAENFETFDKSDVKDLKNLISIIEVEKFIVKRSLYINPSFGNGSALVGGADADLIIDDTLIDIKVTKELKLERKHLNQIIGYYSLSLIGGINTNPNLKMINSIGIYFARHGELWTFQ